jgi:CRP-like cAMP-binding protein
MNSPAMFFRSNESREEAVVMRERLERFSIFRGLAPEELEAIRALCMSAKFKKGAQIFQVDEEANSLFLVCAGEIELRFNVVCYNATVEILLERKGPGEILGWSAVTYPYKYKLSAYAAEDSELLSIKQASIESLCEANNHLGYQFMKNTARIIAQRFQLAQEALTKEIQDGLRRKDSLA